MVALPQKTDLKMVEVKKVYGQSIFDFYQQVANLLATSRAPLALGAFFAEPIVNRNREEITWYTNFEGEVRSFMQLSQQERTAAASIIAQNCDEFRSAIGRIEKSLGADSPAALALSGMLVTPDISKSIFMVGNNLVLTEWGCFPFGQVPHQFDLDIQRSLISATGKDRPSERDEGSSHVLLNDQEKIAQTGISDSVEEIADPEVKALSATPDKVGLVAPVTVWRLPSLLALSALVLILALLYSNLHQLDLTNAIISAEGRIRDLKEVIRLKIADCSTILSPRSSISPQDVDDRLQRQTVTQGSKGNISLAWSSKVDLDLYVVEPDGTRIDQSQRVSVASGGKLDIDANRCTVKKGCVSVSNPVENISWNDNMPNGLYRIQVGLFSINGEDSELDDVPFTVVKTINGVKSIKSGVISKNSVLCHDRCATLRMVEFDSFTIR